MVKKINKRFDAIKVHRLFLMLYKQYRNGHKKYCEKFKHLLTLKL